MHHVQKSYLGLVKARLLLLPLCSAVLKAVMQSLQVSVLLLHTLLKGPLHLDMPLQSMFQQHIQLCTALLVTALLASPVAQHNIIRPTSINTRVKCLRRAVQDLVVHKLHSIWCLTLWGVAPTVTHQTSRREAQVNVLYEKNQAGVSSAQRAFCPAAGTMDQTEKSIAP